MKLTVSQTNALVNFAQTGKFKPADPVESLIALGLVSRTGHKYAEGTATELTAAGKVVVNENLR